MCPTGSPSASLRPAAPASASRRAWLLALSALVAAACSSKHDEPGQATGKTAEPKVPPVSFEVPPTWSKTESSDTRERRAGYKVPKVGNDTEDAELLVLFFGTGSNGDRDKQWDPWFEQYDGDAKGQATRETLSSKAGLAVETFEFVGNYKLNMGPRRPGMTKSPVQMVKKDFRMIGAVVRAGERGNWFVRLVGPNETVLASRDAFLELLKSAQ